MLNLSSSLSKDQYSTLGSDHRGFILRCFISVGSSPPLSMALLSKISVSKQPVHCAQTSKCMTPETILKFGSVHTMEPPSILLCSAEDVKHLFIQSIYPVYIYTTYPSVSNSLSYQLLYSRAQAQVIMPQSTRAVLLVTQT